jgi:hypothetical protein
MKTHECHVPATCNLLLGQTLEMFVTFIYRGLFSRSYFPGVILVTLLHVFKGGGGRCTSSQTYIGILTTSINNAHINGKIRKPFAVPKHFPRESSEARPILQTLCHLFDWVGLTSLPASLRHSHRRVHSARSTFTFFKLANCTHVAYRVYPTRYLGNAMQRRFSISAL